MAESEVSVRFTSKEEAQLWQSFVKLTSGLNKTRSELEETVTSSAKLDASLARFASREIKLNATPFEQFAEKAKQLDEALEAGLLTREQHARATESATKKLAEAMGEADEELKSFAEGIRSLNATPLDRLREKNEQLAKAVKAGHLTEVEASKAAKRHQDEYQRELDQTKSKQQQLGAGAVAAGSMIASAWQTALAQVSRIATVMRAENDRALGVQQASGKSLGSLAQIAESPEEMTQLSGLARGLVASGAAPDMSVAVNTVFDAKSSGSIGDLEQLRQLSEPGVIGNLSEVIKSAASLRAAMGAESAGSISDLMGKAFAAAGPSTASAEGVLIGAARAGSQAKSEGVSVDELLAGTGIIATARGSAEEGGTRMAALLRGMEDDTALQGKSLVERIEDIQSRNLAAPELTKQLTAEGADAFRILANSLEDLRATAKATAEQVTEETFARKRAIAIGEGAVNVDMLARQAKARGDMARESEGRVVALQEAAIEEGVTQRRAIGGSGLVGKAVGLGGLLPERVSNELDAAAFGGFMRNIFATAPGNALAESMAGSDRTPTGIREALTAAIAERDAERARFAEQLNSAAQRFERASQSMERAANRPAPPARFDVVGPARRESAVRDSQ